MHSKTKTNVKQTCGQWSPEAIADHKHQQLVHRKKKKKDKALICRKQESELVSRVANRTQLHTTLIKRAGDPFDLTETFPS